jgi:ABC-type multidrug transport system ATPase subunit
MGICEKITVLDHGETIAVGTPSEVRKNRKVIEAYLGDSYLAQHGDGFLLGGAGSGGRHRRSLIKMDREAPSGQLKSLRAKLSRPVWA